jgi:hypothetical protein
MHLTCFFGSPVAQFSRWLMIASMATALLPVWRSPMISWRWPRPMAVMASTALMPVCSGSPTGWRCTTVGACSSRMRRPSATISPLPSIGLPSGSTTRRGSRRRPGPRGCRRAADRLALLDAGRVAQQHGADLAGVEVERQAEHAALELEQLVGHRGVQALDAGDAVTDLGDGADLLTGGLGAVRRDVLLDRGPDVLRADAELRHLWIPAL